jgi:hypothetical protein
VLVWTNPWGSRYRELAGPPGPWSLRSRLLVVAAAAAGAALTFADDTLRPAETAAAVAMLLVFPVAWVLLARSPRTGGLVGAVLVAGTAVWSLGTVRLASYETPPNVDELLRWQLAVTGGLVAAVGLYEWKGRRRGGRRWVAGIAVWAAGVAATVAVPNVDGGQMPPRDAVLPLPPAMTMVSEQASCHPMPAGGSTCVRRFTVTSTDRAPDQELIRQVGEHLERDKGWSVTWSGSSPTPGVDCRRAGWFLDPYRLCVWMSVDEEQSGVEISLGYSNRHDPQY